jgi:hypothetical protein
VPSQPHSENWIGDAKFKATSFSSVISA